MTKTHFLVCLGVVVALNAPFSLGIAMVITLWGWWTTRKMVWVVVFLSVILHPHLKEGLPVWQDGIVSELNDRSALVTYGHHKILIPSTNTVWVGDQVTFLDPTPIETSEVPGDQSWMEYVHLQGLVGTVPEAAILSVRRLPIMSWVVDQWAKDEGFESVVRKLLFQSDLLGVWGLITGTGLIYAMIHRSLGALFSLILRDPVNAGVRLFLWIGLAVMLGYPIGLLRFVVSALTGRLIKDRWMRWTTSVAVLWLLDPSLLCSMTVLIPLFFQVLGLLRTEASLRSVSFTLLQGVLWHRVSPLVTLGYPVWRMGLMLSVLGVWIATPFTVFQGPVTSGVMILASVMRAMTHFWILRGHFSVPVLMALWGAWKISKWTPRLRAAWILAVVIYLPGLSAPWLASVTVIDVGQGNAVLLSSPFNRSVVLIDTGRSFALREVNQTLDHLGILRLDALILTHDDIDHTENQRALCEDYRVRSVLRTADDLVLSDLALTSLDASVASPSDNQRSLVFGFKWENTRFVFTGDADMTNEAALISRYPHLRTEVLLVGHHGSSGSTSSEWLGTLQPRLVIISVGSNAYGHPALAVLDRLAAFHIPVLTTRNEGSIRFVMTPWATILITDSWKLKVLR